MNGSGNDSVCLCKNLRFIEIGQPYTDFSDSYNRKRKKKFFMIHFTNDWFMSSFSIVVLSKLIQTQKLSLLNSITFTKLLKSQKHSKQPWHDHIIHIFLRKTRFFFSKRTKKRELSILVTFHIILISFYCFINLSRETKKKNKLL